MKKPKIKKIIWGHWKIGEGIILIEDKRVPFRLMLNLPYDWHLKHGGKWERNHEKKTR